MCVMAMYLTYVIDPVTFKDYYGAMCMIALVCSGLVMLFRVCQPFNGYRLVLYLANVAICAVALCIPVLAELLYSGWSLIQWDYAKLLIIAVVIEAAFPISKWMISIMEIVMPSSASSKKPQPREAQQGQQ